MDAWKHNLCVWIGLWMLVLSAIAFVMMVWDKRQARLGRWRIAEGRLHVISLLGGWPGILLGRTLVRHKTRKVAYRLVLCACIALHVAMVLGVLWWRGWRC